MRPVATACVRRSLEDGVSKCTESTLAVVLRRLRFMLSWLDPQAIWPAPNFRIQIILS